MWTFVKDINKNINGIVLREGDDYDIVMDDYSEKEIKKFFLKGILINEHSEDELFKECGVILYDYILKTSTKRVSDDLEQLLLKSNIVYFGRYVGLYYKDISKYSYSQICNILCYHDLYNKYNPNKHWMLGRLNNINHHTAVKKKFKNFCKRMNKITTLYVPSIHKITNTNDGMFGFEPW